MPTLKSGTPNEQGFTLLEFVVVILILGIVFGVALPRLFRGADAEPLRLSSTQLAETIRRVRVHAVSGGQLLRIRFTLPEGKWVVEGMDAEGNWLKLANSPVKNGRISEEVRLRQVSIGGRQAASRGDVFLRFFPSGETEKAALYLIDRALKERTLSVHPFYNHVEILHGRTEEKSS